MATVAEKKIDPQAPEKAAKDEQNAARVEKKTSMQKRLTKKAALRKNPLR